MQFFCHGAPNTPLQRYPSDEGLEYETVYFPAYDGVMIEAWYMPSKGSNKLIICNHPMTFNKGGYPGNQKGYDAFGPIVVSPDDVSRLTSRST